ncbi:MAG: hypothetical protein ACE15C_16195 [Phycisphaerae bacterium]
MEPLLVFLALVGVLVLGFCLMLWQFGRSRELVERWAAANGFTILAIQRRFFRRGPFFWRTGKGMEVFHVVLRDGHGAQRQAYVRAGGWFLGVFSDKVAVEWGDSERVQVERR